MDRRFFLKSAIAAGSVLYFISPSFAADEIFTGIVPGVAIGGYDSVSYFSKGEAIKGDKAIATSYKGAEWRFSSKKTLICFQLIPKSMHPNMVAIVPMQRPKARLPKVILKRGQFMRISFT